MLKSKPITKYYGFTEDEVKELCERFDMDFETVRAWYNGYLIDGIHMYNPNSVVQSMIDHDCDSYWRNTSSFESINPNTFRNDLSIITSKDDALITALIHLGYLGYDADRKSAYVPNYEIATALN